MLQVSSECWPPLAVQQPLVRGCCGCVRAWLRCEIEAEVSGTEADQVLWRCGHAGGWLHIHENVLDSEEKNFTAQLPGMLQGLAVGLGREGWGAEVRHVERVKWYAPHIRHLVLDVWCGPAV